MNKGALSGLSESLRPEILVSRCISFDHCRWDGGIITSPYVEKLKEHIDFMTVCPEADIGCGVPRKPLRLVMNENSVRMLQHETGADFTEAMREYTEAAIRRMPLIDGMLLKERSPSCGIANVKLYAANEKGAAIQKKGPGLFGGALREAFPFTPCITKDICSISLSVNISIRLFSYWHVSERSMVRSGSGILWNFIPGTNTF